MSLESLIQKVTAIVPQEAETQFNQTQNHLSQVGKSYNKSFSSKKQHEEKEVQAIKLDFDSM
jgi:hypothetical protein